MEINPIPINAMFRSLEQFFNDPYINKLKNKFKDKEKDEFYRFNQRWDDTLEILHYDEDRNVLVPVQESFSDFVNTNVQSEVTRIRKLYAELVRLEVNKSITYEYTKQFDNWLIKLHKRIGGLSQLPLVIQHLEESIDILRRSNSSILNQIGSIQEAPVAAYWKKSKSTIVKNKVFTNQCPKEIWLEPLVHYLIEKKVITTESKDSFKKLFEDDGLSSHPDLKIKWIKKCEGNHKLDTGSISSLLNLIVDKGFINYWGKATLLSETVKKYFVDESNNSIALSSTSISKNRNNYNIKFPELGHLLKGGLFK